MDEELAEIKARREAVRGLPWELDGNEIIDPQGRVIAEVIGRTNPLFLVNAPADIDWLVGEVERLRGLLASVSALTAYPSSEVDRVIGILEKMHTGEV